MYICTKCILFSSLTAHIVEIYKAKIANYSSHKAAYPNALHSRFQTFTVTAVHLSRADSETLA